MAIEFKDGVLTHNHDENRGKQSFNTRHEHFRQLLLDNDIPESDIERLAIQNGWSMQQICEWYLDQGVLELPQEPTLTHREEERQASLQSWAEASPEDRAGMAEAGFSPD